MAAACCLFLTAGLLAQSPAAAPAPKSDSLPLPASITPNGTVVEDVIARINDQIITRSDVERAQMQLDHELATEDLTPEQRTERQADLLRDLIDQQLLLSKGKELDINADAQVITQLDEIRKQNHFANMEELEKAAQQSGVSFEDFKANIRNNIISQQVVRDEVGRKMQFTHADSLKYYDAHKADFTVPESVKLSEILIATPSPEGKMPDDATVAAARAKADEVAAKLKAGANFEALAKAESNGPTAAQGGDLGDFKRGALAKELEDQTFSKPVGSVSTPIRTRQGFVLLKVTGYTPAGVQPLADVESQVEEAVYMQQLQPALRAYLTQLREEAYVDIKPGFVDSGASAKQTKPIFTAFALPTGKKQNKAEPAKKTYDRRGHLIPAPTPAPVKTAGTATAATAAPAAATKAAAPAPAASTSSAKPANVKVSKGKVKREKIRYGQAPRELLPQEASAQAAAAPTEVGSAQGTASMMTEALPDPNAAPDTANPLTPKAAPRQKARYAQHPEPPKKPKVKAAPPAAPKPTVEESAAEKTQAAPLGLNGDTSRKKSKAKRTGPKQRLEEKPAPATAPAPAATPAPAPQMPSAPAPSGSKGTP